MNALLAGCRRGRTSLCHPGTQTQIRLHLKAVHRRDLRLLSVSVPLSANKQTSHGGGNIQGRVTDATCGGDQVEIEALTHIAQLYTQITLPSRPTAGSAMSTIVLSTDPKSMWAATIRDRKCVPPARCADIDQYLSSFYAGTAKRESSSNGSSTTRGSRDMGIPRGFCDSRISLGPGERRPARIHRRHVDAIPTSVVPCAETRTKRFSACGKFC